MRVCLQGGVIEHRFASSKTAELQLEPIGTKRLLAKRFEHAHKYNAGFRDSGFVYWLGSFICSLKVVSKQQLDSSSERSFN